MMILNNEALFKKNGRLIADWINVEGFTYYIHSLPDRYSQAKISTSFSQIHLKGRLIRTSAHSWMASEQGSTLGCSNHPNLPNSMQNFPQKDSSSILFHFSKTLVRLHRCTGHIYRISRIIFAEFDRPHSKIFPLIRFQLIFHSLNTWIKKGF